MPTSSATRFVVAGVIAALVGVALLIAPFARQGSGPGTAPGDAGTFSPTGRLASPRSEHSATLLLDGRVLVVGGANWSNESLIATADIWDPATETFGPTGAPAELRASHTATLLPDGRVLVVGGFGKDGPFRAKLASAEIWDPDTTSFSPAGSLAGGSDSHRATLLADGRVLVFGGIAFPAQVWDPATSTFGPPGSHGLDEPISSATLLADGRVLVIGDKDPVAAEVWDPATSTSSPAGSPTEAHGRRSATALPDGRVLILGGCSRYCADVPDPPASAEIWDPATASFSPAGSLAVGRAGPATLLADGRVLVVGGFGGRIDLASAEIWEPTDG